MQSKRRVLKVVIYSVYMYLFCKRFILVLRYFKNVMKRLFKTQVSLLKRLMTVS